MNGMSAWVDQIIVGLLVIASVGFACYRLGPRKLRFWMRRQWARARGKPMPLVDTSGAGCDGCANAAAPKPRGQTRIAADNIRKFER
jgi:hypothetical protein